MVVVLRRGVKIGVDCNILDIQGVLYHRWGDCIS